MTQRPYAELLEVARSVSPVFAGSRLVAMRELLGWTQAEVAEATQISPSALSQAERGGHNPGRGQHRPGRIVSPNLACGLH